MTGCKTVYVPVAAEIPTLDAVQPTRPTLKKVKNTDGSICLAYLIDNTIELITYSRQWEEYGRTVTEYIKTITCTD